MGLASKCMGCAVTVLGLLACTALAATATERTIEGESGCVGLVEAPLDGATMCVAVRRDATAQRVTLTVSGALEVGDEAEQGIPATTFTVLVYPDLATADRDAGGEGLESLFRGSVTMTDRISTEGGFTEREFEVVDAADGRALRPAGEVTIHVAADDVDAIVVRLVADTRAAEAVVPAISPFMIAWLWLLLAAAGSFGIAALRRRETFASALASIPGQSRRGP